MKNRWDFVGALFLVIISLGACAPTVRLVVGFSKGDGFDTYSRLIARHIGKHIPGSPSTEVANMTGAGSLIAANYMYSKAKPDGFTIGNWHGPLVMQQVMKARPGIRFNARKFEWIGAPVADFPVCALTKQSGITSVDKWFAAKGPVRIGATGLVSITSDVPRILRAALGLPIQVVMGYRGTRQIRVAAESGEIAGGCWAWQSMKYTWRRGIALGEVLPVLQAAPKKYPDLPHVPNAIDLAKTDEARRLIQVGIHDQAAITRAYSLPPGTPKEQVKILRKAFMNTMRDPDFLAEARRIPLEINPISGEQVERIVAGFFKLEPAMVTRLRNILLPKRLATLYNR